MFGFYIEGLGECGRQKIYDLSSRETPISSDGTNPTVIDMTALGAGIH